jgi:hypothetical protein
MKHITWNEISPNNVKEQSILHVQQRNMDPYKVIKKQNLSNRYENLDEYLGRRQENKLA